MITITTGDLLGLIGDVYSMAHPDPECTNLHVIRIEWDGRMLSTLATDSIRTGISSWHPDDDPETDRQDSMFTHFGGADDPWAVNLRLGNVEELLATFKPKNKKKESWLPLNLDFDPGQYRLKVSRSRDTGYPAKSMTVDGLMEEFPDVRAEMAHNDTLAAIREIDFNPALLAEFSNVRTRGGVMTMSFTGVNSLCHVAIGERFVGAIRPVRRSAQLRSVA